MAARLIGKRCTFGGHFPAPLSATFQRNLLLSLLCAVVVLGWSPAGAEQVKWLGPTHWVILFDDSGSVGSLLGHASRRPVSVAEIVRTVLDGAPLEQMPSYEPSADLVTLTFFSLVRCVADYKALFHHPLHLAASKDLDGSVRDHVGRHNEFGGGWSPVAVSLEAALPALAHTPEGWGPLRGRDVGRTILVRITDGKLNTKTGPAQELDYFRFNITLNPEPCPGQTPPNPRSANNEQFVRTWLADAAAAFDFSHSRACFIEGAAGGPAPERPHHWKLDCGPPPPTPSKDQERPKPRRDLFVSYVEAYPRALLQVVIDVNEKEVPLDRAAVSPTSIALTGSTRVTVAHPASAQPQRLLRRLCQPDCVSEEPIEPARGYQQRPGAWGKTDAYVIGLPQHADPFKTVERSYRLQYGTGLVLDIPAYGLKKHVDQWGPEIALVPREQRDGMAMHAGFLYGTRGPVRGADLLAAFTPPRGATAQEIASRSHEALWVRRLWVAFVAAATTVGSLAWFLLVSRVQLVARAEAQSRGSVLVNFNHRRRESACMVGSVVIENVARPRGGPLGQLFGAPGPGRYTEPPREIRLRILTTPPDGLLLDAGGGGLWTVGGVGQADDYVDPRGGHGREYPVFVNPSRLRDCEWPVPAHGPLTQPVELDVAISEVRRRRFGGSERVVPIGGNVRIAFDLVLVPEDTEPRVTAVWLAGVEAAGDVKPLAQVEHEIERDVTLGHLAVRSSAEHRFARKVRCDLQLQTRRVDEAGRVDMPGAISVPPDREHLQVAGITRDAPQDLPLLLRTKDATRVRNPSSTSDRYELTVTIFDDRPRPGLVEVVVVDKDSGVTDAEVLVRVPPGNKTAVLLRPATVPVELDYPDPVVCDVLEHLPRPWQPIAIIVLKNTAKQGHGRVYVHVSTALTSAQLPALDTMAGDDQTAFVADGAADAEVRVQMPFRQLVKLLETSAQHTVNVRFVATVSWRNETRETDGGPYTEGVLHQATVVVPLKLFRTAGTHWVCLDFGTQAITAAVWKNEARGDDKVVLLDLQGHYQHLEESNQPSRARARYNEEHGTRFIPSLFHINDEPPRRISDPSFLQIPADAYSALLQPDRCLYGLKVRIAAATGMIPVSTPVNVLGQDQPVTDLPLRDVLMSTYANLKERYLEPLLKAEQLGAFSRLIVTHPNTFAPEDVEVLRDVLRSVFENVHPDYLRLVSESDAVAGYYLSLPDVVPDSPRPQQERVLIYDLGAGTLDLTLLDVHWDDARRQPMLVILHRDGFGVAGNMFDRVIARFVHRKLTELARSHGIRYDLPIVSNTIPDYLRTAGAKPGLATRHRSALAYLRQGILGFKAGLRADGASPIDLGLAGGDTPSCVVAGPSGGTLRIGKVDGDDHYLLDIDHAELLSDPLAEAYMRFLTEDVPRVFMSDARVAPETVTTLVITGRAAQLLDLRQRVRRYFPAALFASEIEPNHLKEAVARGALGLFNRWPWMEIHDRVRGPRYVLDYGRGKRQDLFGDPAKWPAGPVREEGGVRRTPYLPYGGGTLDLGDSVSLAVKRVSGPGAAAAGLFGKFLESQVGGAIAVAALYPTAARNRTTEWKAQIKATRLLELELQNSSGIFLPWSAVVTQESVDLPWPFALPVLAEEAP